MRKHVDALIAASAIVREAASTIEIDWTQEPANAFERELRARIIADIEAGPHPVHDLSRLLPNAADDAPASDLDAAITRAYAAYDAEKRREHRAFNQALIRKALAGGNGDQVVDRLDRVDAALAAIHERAKHATAPASASEIDYADPVALLQIGEQLAQVLSGRADGVKRIVGKLQSAYASRQCFSKRELRALLNALRPCIAACTPEDEVYRLASDLSFAADVQRGDLVQGPSGEWVLPNDLGEAA